jgi:hypothetical protein
VSSCAALRGIGTWLGVKRYRRTDVTASTYRPYLVAFGIMLIASLL